MTLNNEELRIINH